LTVVVDANLVVALAIDRERGPLVDAQFKTWAADGETMHAPSLLRYEAANALARTVASGDLSTAAAEDAFRAISELSIVLHELEDGSPVLRLTAELKRRSAYDAAYLALAQQLGAVLWTFDGPLARNAGGRGLPVRLIEQRPSAPASPHTHASSRGAATRGLNPANLRRGRELLSRLERRDDYGRLLLEGQVIRPLNDIGDPAGWRAEIRRKARADRISVRTFQGKNALIAVMNRELTEEQMEAGHRWFNLVFKLGRQAHGLGHELGTWVRDGNEAVNACHKCHVVGYVDQTGPEIVVDGDLFKLPCPDPRPPTPTWWSLDV
jgi:predicted nucleic acid-binding protein